MSNGMFDDSILLNNINRANDPLSQDKDEQRAFEKMMQQQMRNQAIREQNKIQHQDSNNTAAQQGFAPPQKDATETARYVQAWRNINGPIIYKRAGSETSDNGRGGATRGQADSKAPTTTFTKSQNAVNANAGADEGSSGQQHDSSQENEEPQGTLKIGLFGFKKIKGESEQTTGDNENTADSEESQTQQVPHTASQKQVSLISDRQERQHGQSSSSDSEEEQNKDAVPMGSEGPLLVPVHSKKEKNNKKSNQSSEEQMSKLVNSISAPTPVTSAVSFYSIDSPFVIFIVGFCSNPSVQAQGEWEATIPLNPNILPETKLLIRITFFDLSLEFYTDSPYSYELICKHKEELRDNLTLFLKNRGKDYRVDITVYNYL